MDIGFSVNGVLYGTFSCEQIGATMVQTLREVYYWRPKP